MKKNQQGMTFFGVVFIGMALVMGAILIMKLIPPYLEFWSVKKVISVMANDPALSSMSVPQVQKSFQNRAGIDDITVIRGTDLEISKDRGQTVVTASYSVVVPIVGNISALIEFEASTKGTEPPKMVGG